MKSSGNKWQYLISLIRLHISITVLNLERNTTENFLKKDVKNYLYILTTSSKFVNVDKCYPSEFQFGT